MTLKLAPNIGRLGSESAFEVVGRAARLSAEGRDIINLGIGQPDFKTPPHIVEAAVKALHDGHHGYTAPEGLPALREAVAADLFNRHGATANPGNILITPGGKPTMFFAILLFAQPGAEIIYPDPGFPIYRSMIDYGGATAVPMRLHEGQGFSLLAEEVLAQITPRTSLIIINSPGNPTGGAVAGDELDKLVAGLDNHPQVAVLSDEIYSRLIYDGRKHLSLLRYPTLKDRLILLDGWSKAYAMTGWRLGFGVWPPSLMEPATRLAINSYSCVNAATQYAGLAALQGPQDALAGMMAAFSERRRLILSRLNDLQGVTCREPAGAFYAFPNIAGTGLSARELQDRLLEEAGIATIAGTSFGDGGRGHIRISYANTKANIERALSRMADWLSGQRPS